MTLRDWLRRTEAWLAWQIPGEPYSAEWLQCFSQAVAIVRRDLQTKQIVLTRARLIEASHTTKATQTSKAN